MQNVLEEVRSRAVSLWEDENILDRSVNVVTGPLTVEQAIGNPDGSDFPIQQGKERLMEAGFDGPADELCRGQAFTDKFGRHSAKLSEIAKLSLDDNFNRAVFVAALNAVMRSLGRTQNTIHCRDKGPSTCAGKVAEYIHSTYGEPKITLVGFQPAMIGALGERFKLRVLDLDPDNVGQVKRGTLVEGAEATDDALDWADLLWVTGTTLVNSSIDRFVNGKPVVFYGTTIAGAAELMGWQRFCPQSM